MTSQQVDASITELRSTLDTLLRQPIVSYSGVTPSSFPEEKGIYIIFGDQRSVLRAGATGRKAATLSQRLYKNHLMGDQGGNLRAQLVGSKTCADFAEAKDWIRRKCSVQFLVIKDDAARARTEHFMLAVVRPRFCDNNKWD